MCKLFVLPAFLFWTTGAFAQTPEISQSSDATQATQTYAQSKDGFSSQFAAILQAYRDGNKTKGHQLIGQFRLPRSEAWFAEHLTLEHATQLEEQYDKVFASFAESYEKTIMDVVDHPGADVVADLEGPKPEKPTTIGGHLKLSGIVPAKEPHLSICYFKIRVKKKEVGSWEDTFGYEDGAFRFLGLGAWAFWVWEAGSGLGATKEGRFPHHPVLVSQVAPIYPSSAKAKGIEGTVLVSVQVDEEGRVKSASIITGDSALGAAALDSVRQWRYQPLMIGGNPTEFNLVTSVVFTLH